MVLCKQHKVRHFNGPGSRIAKGCAPGETFARMGPPAGAVAQMRYRRMPNVTVALRVVFCGRGRFACVITAGHAWPIRIGLLLQHDTRLAWHVGTMQVAHRFKPVFHKPRKPSLPQGCASAGSWYPRLQRHYHCTGPKREGKHPTLAALATPDSNMTAPHPELR